MTERLLMIGLTALVVGGVGVILVGLLVRRALPATALGGFQRRGEMPGYFGAALSVLVRKRWLLYVPFAITVLSYGMMSVPMLRHARTRQDVSAEERLPSRSVLGHARAVVRVVLHASRVQFAGYAGVFGASLPIGGAVLALGVLVGERRLRRVTDQENLARFGVVRVAAMAVLVSASVAVFLGVRGVEVRMGLWPWLLVASLLTWLFGLFLLAVVQGCFLCTVRGLLQESSTSVHDVWNGAVRALYPLVVFGVAWTVIVAVPDYTSMAIGQWGSLSGVSHRVLHLVSKALAMWRRFVPSGLGVLFCCAPFFVVVNGERAMAALAATLRFIGEHTLKWAVMVAACVVVAAVPYLVGEVVGLWLPMHSWERFGLGFVTDSVRIVAVAVSAIALFGFFLRYGAKKDDEGEHRSSGDECRVGSRTDGGGV